MDMPRNVGIIGQVGWREIDDAARASDDILLFCPDAAEPKITIGFWAEWEDGSANWSETWGTAQELDVEPTHWMPLPEIPA